MNFYSGFSLQNEEYLFEPFLKEGEYTVSGFSYGAIKALNIVVQALEDKKRVDTLQLISPAFFQSKPEKFKRLQLMSYKKNTAVYLEQFLKGCFAPYEFKIVENIQTDISELEELLYYEWDIEILEKIVNAGVKIEVYLGSKDAIIDLQSAREFFLKVATVTYIKEANHFLQLS